MIIYNFTIGRPKRKSSNGIVSFTYNMQQFFKSESDISIITVSKGSQESWFSFIIKSYRALRSGKDSVSICIFHGIFHPIFLLLYLTIYNRKFYWFCHGSLNKTALSKSYVKKWVFIFLLRCSNIFRPLSILALNQAERHDIFKVFSRALVDVVRPIMRVDNNQDNTKFWAPKKKNETRKVIFIGRYDIYTKGLDTLIEVARNLTPENNCAIELYGPLSGYGSSASDLQKLRSSILHKDLVKVNDSIYGSEKYRTITGADAMILLSRNEGLPVTAVEALSFGVPVLATYETNLPNVSEPGLQLLPRDPNVILTALQSFSSLSKVEQITARKSAKKIFDDFFAPELVLNDYKNLFLRK